MEQGLTGSVGECGIGGYVCDRVVDRFGGLVVVEVLEPALGCAGEELAAGESEALCGCLDPFEGLVGERDSGLHDLSITRSYCMFAPAVRAFRPGPRTLSCRIRTVDRFMVMACEL